MLSKSKNLAWKPWKEEMFSNNLWFKPVLSPLACCVRKFQDELSTPSTNKYILHVLLYRSARQYWQAEVGLGRGNEPSNLSREYKDYNADCWEQCKIPLEYQGECWWDIFTGWICKRKQCTVKHWQEYFGIRNHHLFWDSPKLNSWCFRKLTCIITGMYPTSFY